MGLLPHLGGGRQQRLPVRAGTLLRFESRRSAPAPPLPSAALPQEPAGPEEERQGHSGNGEALPCTRLVASAPAAAHPALMQSPPTTPPFSPPRCADSEQEGEDWGSPAGHEADEGGHHSEGEEASEVEEGGTEEDDGDEDDEGAAWSGEESSGEEDLYAVLNRAASSAFARQVRRPVCVCVCVVAGGGGALAAAPAGPAPGCVQG